MSLKSIAVVLFAVLLSACAATSGQSINEDDIEAITEGITTEADLIATFGDPSIETMSSSGEKVLAWGYASVSMWSAQNTSQGLSVTLSSDGTVKDYSTSTMTTPEARLGE